jgi:capsular polysaccharide transport system ATP-binding protein
VVVSHQARVLETYCQRAAVLCDGRMQFFDTLEEAKRLYDYSD